MTFLISSVLWAIWASRMRETMVLSRNTNLCNKGKGIAYVPCCYQNMLCMFPTFLCLPFCCSYITSEYSDCLSISTVTKSATTPISTIQFYCRDYSFVTSDCRQHRDYIFHYPKETLTWMLSIAARLYTSFV